MKALTLISLIAAAALAPAVAQKRDGRGPKIAKPRIEDTVKANVYADNWFQLYINGELVATDSINFIPHNVVSVDVLPSYPMTIAVMAKDNADARTGMEYNDTQIGDGGFILKLGDGTVTSAKWKAKKFFWGPVGGDTENPRTETIPIPENWHAVDFDDSDWKNAAEFAQDDVGPKKPFFDHDFEGAKFIWSGDLKLDNTVIFRHRVDTPPDGKTKSWDMSKPPYANPSTLSATDDQSKERDRLAPKQAAPFQAFGDKVKLRWDDKFLYVESNGMPDHRMMVGITAWNQQVPIPQEYSGDNAFYIPLKPQLADEVTPAPFKGPIAVAANGIPIFNPIKQDGRTDTFAAGELDEFGGHAGRADDYHYHIVPPHLKDELPEGSPLAYALDGFPIFAQDDLKGHQPAAVDKINGHTHEHPHTHTHDGSDYHYHTSKEMPYLNGGFRGEVDLSLQPRAEGVRPFTRPLRGAKVTGFESEGDHHRLEYELDGKKHAIRYEVAEDRSTTFQFIAPDGTSTTETYSGKRPARSQDERPEPRADRGDGTRQPWITAHKDELDSDGDEAISLAEMMAEAKKAFAAYDSDGDGQISAAEAKGSGVKGAMGGFVRQHFDELDRDSSGSVSAEELANNAKRMFTKSDRDGDGKVSGEEFGQTRGGGGRRSDGSRRDKRPHTEDEDGRLPPRRPQAAVSSARKPNIVMILVDDMGWKDMGFAGNTFVETTHCDHLAREGVIFTQAYASAPNCAPTRACLLSGQYTPRHGVYTVVDDRHSPGQAHHKILAAESKASMATEVVTIAEALKPAGYATAMFGMWNLGRGRSGPETPTGQGFDHYVSTKTLGFEKHAYRDGDRYLTDAFTDEIIQFIDATENQPFFVYFAPHATHHPYDPKADLLAKYQRKENPGRMSAEYAATIEALDQNVGRLFHALQQRGLADDTLIVFTADNGGTPDNVAPLNGSKGSLYDGGLRVPTFVWSRGIRSPGRKSDTPITSTDFFPTVLEMAGLPAPKDQLLDGMSLVAEFCGRRLPDRDLFWHFPCYIGRGSPSSAIRRGNHKLIQWYEDERIELFDLASDPGEQNNLADSSPQLTDSMQAALRRWQVQTAAALPSGQNPDYDPTASSRGKGRSQRSKAN